MGLNTHQWAFFCDVCELFNYIRRNTPNNWNVRISWAYRPQYAQCILFNMREICTKAPAVTNTLSSQHTKYLAIDLDFFVDGVYLEKPTPGQRDVLWDIGEYWEALSPEHKNRYGGFWEKKDWGHFEKNE